MGKSGKEKTQPGRAVGAVVPVSKDDLDTLEEMFKPAAELLRELGKNRVDYLERERQLEGTRQQYQAKFNDLVRAVARKMGIDVDNTSEAWRFELDKGTFTRMR